MDSLPEDYHTNVGICLADPSLTKIFSTSRIDIPTAWQMPQGGIDLGEEPRATTMRELREETGVRSAKIVAEAPNWLTYDFPADVKDKLNARWGTNWKGQAQNWKKKAVHKTATTDDKRLQSMLKRVGVNTILAIEEVNIFKDDLVIQFLNPKVVPSIGVLHHLPDNMEHLKRIAEEMQKQVAVAGAIQPKEETDLEFGCIM
ncbi:hypothetical protein ZWY2020_040294 [Hordeum vulgare]|nr:hypothetical protein ZWY2020_040294 [Hordeum vulgare]